jgi:hypothetical protein
MSRTERFITGAHKSQLVTEGFLAIILVTLVAATTILAATHALQQSTVSAIFVGIIGVVGGKASNNNRPAPPARASDEANIIRGEN